MTESHKLTRDEICDVWKNSGGSTDEAIQQAYQLGREREREEIADSLEPKRPRPCDCETCDCHNSGNREAVSSWDNDKHTAAAIRGRKP